MSNVLRINGRSVKDLGLGVRSMGPFYAAPEVDRDYYSVLGRVGAVPMVFAPGREKRIPVQMRMASALASRRGALDAVWGLLQGMMAVEWEDSPGRVMWAIMDRRMAEVFRPGELGWSQGDILIDTEWIVPSGVSWDIQPIGLGLPAGVPVYLPLGTATTAGTVVVPGEVYDYRLEYGGDTGEVLSAIQTIGYISPIQYLEVDAFGERLTIGETEYNTRANAAEYYGSGAFPVLDPNDTRPGGMPWLVASADSYIYYRRAWE